METTHKIHRDPEEIVDVRVEEKKRFCSDELSGKRKKIWTFILDYMPLTF